jgi:hypothetical protein
VKQEATVYCEYFRERAACCRRSAEGANAWLAEVSLELAVMFDEMAVDTLIREHTRRNEAAAVTTEPKADRPTQPAATMTGRERLPRASTGMAAYRL